MKLLLMLIVIGAASFPFLFSACQNHPPQSREEFDQNTHRTYNPQTGSFEQSPPFGKQSNKSGGQ
jgi:hypothetical protein